ncbi:mannan endo-1,4-beta-mannosidase [Aplysia californica]|uniref:Mannan endo-1,4-beta-mannosidase n=1 Tax=Aplysia californica TaxID=6500 RepID=A0ABM0JRQ0_APLCA|nr:mannan endo-1,4-beta-mannosidase [Aplysia californica]
MKIACVLLLVALMVHESSQRLTVSGKTFRLNNQQVFLSGGNLPWINYARDFGNHQWSKVKPKIEEQIRLLHQAGGNTMRLWVHIQAESSPKFSSSGFVTAPDNDGTLLNDIKDLLDTALKYDVLIIPCLWNGAVNQDNAHRLEGLVTNQQKLQSYIDKALKPMVAKVKGHKALGAWEIINEPEGLMIPGVKDNTKCYDTVATQNDGMGWAAHKYKYKDMLRFINWQAAAVKAVDPGALVTMGVWNPKSNTDHFGKVNHYSDACLRLAGGKHAGVLDFYQFHSYSWQNKWDNVSPFVNSASAYGLNKPIVVGEFWEKESAGMNMNELFSYAYNHGYAGAWSWDLMTYGPSQRAGMTHIKNLSNHGKVHIDL